MSGYIEGVDREQVTLFPERLEDWIGEDHAVRVIDGFVDALDLLKAGFERTAPANTGRPGYHPSVLLKLFIYGYLNRVPSSRRLEREAGRNVEVMWLGVPWWSSSSPVRSHRTDVILLLSRARMFGRKRRRLAKCVAVDSTALVAGEVQSQLQNVGGEVAIRCSPHERPLCATEPSSDKNSQMSAQSPMQTCPDNQSC